MNIYNMKLINSSLYCIDVIARSFRLVCALACGVSRPDILQLFQISLDAIGKAFGQAISPGEGSVKLDREHTFTLLLLCLPVECGSSN